MKRMTDPARIGVFLLSVRADGEGRTCLKGQPAAGSAARPSAEGRKNGRRDEMRERGTAER